MDIILATYNQGKAREIAEIMHPVGIRHLRDLGIELDFDSLEDGETYEENAFKKARAVAGEAEGIVVSDDSGLEVEALEGRPGVHSARYGGEGIDDQTRYVKLLEELGDIPDEGRSAKFVCVVAVVFPGGLEKTFRGECAGRIAREPRGENGFGYDPVFFLPERGLTMAQITAKEKNTISHRAKAFRALRTHLLGG